MDVVATFQAPAAAVRSADADQLITSFIDLCFNGKAALKAGSATQIAFSDLPSLLRHWFPKRASGQIYRLRASKPSYLLTFTIKPGPRNYVRICALASQAISMDHAWARITQQGEAAPSVQRLRSGSTMMVMPRPDEGYELSLKKIGYHYTVAQVSILNEQQKQAAQETQAELARRARGLQKKR